MAYYFKVESDFKELLNLNMRHSGSNYFNMCGILCASQTLTHSFQSVPQWAFSLQLNHIGLFELIHITAWECAAATHQWKEGAQIRQDYIWSIIFSNGKHVSKKCEGWAKFKELLPRYKEVLQLKLCSVIWRPLPLGNVFTGTQTVGLPSGHPGPLCSENTPAELGNKTTWSRRRQSSRSACQAHYSNTDTIGWGCWHVWRSLLSKLRGSTTHTHPYSLMMFPETSFCTLCKKKHFAVEVDLNRF